MNRKTLAFAGLAVLTVGLVVGMLMPLSAQGAPCGSAFVQSGELSRWNDTAHRVCDDTRNAWRIPAVAGVLLGAFAIAPWLLASGTGQPGSNRRFSAWIQRRENRGHAVFDKRDTGDPYKPR